MSRILQEVLEANNAYVKTFGVKTGRLIEVEAATTAGKPILS